MPVEATPPARRVRVDAWRPSIVGDSTLYAIAFDRSPLGMAIAASEQRGELEIITVNDAMADVFACEPGQLIGRGLRELLGEEPEQPEGSSPSSVTVLERPLMLETGREIWTRWHLTELCAGPGDGGATDRQRTLLVQVEDITARRLAELEAQRKTRLLDLVPEPIIIRSLDGTIRYWNDGAVATYGYSAACALEQRTHALLRTRFDGITVTELEAQLADVGSWSGSLSHRRADGRILHMTSKHIRDDHHDGESVVLEINTDVTERLLAEQALAASEAKFRSQFAHSTVGQLIRRIDGTIEEVNPALATMLGYSVEELVGCSVDKLYESSVAELRNDSIEALTAGTTDAISGEGRLVRADGTLLEVEINVSVARDAEGIVRHVVGIFQDISDRKIAEQVLRQRALYDPLTNLPNRALLAEHLNAAMFAGRVGSSMVGLLFIDLDGFKTVNDMHGHAAGDHLLIEAGSRLIRCVRGEDTVARLGGDEFVVLCPSLASPADLRRIAARALERLAQPYVIGGKVVTGVTASIGVTFPDVGGDPARAIREADRAMYAAKHAGKNSIGYAAQLDQRELRCASEQVAVSAE